MRDLLQELKLLLILINIRKNKSNFTTKSSDLETDVISDDELSNDVLTNIEINAHDTVSKVTNNIADDVHTKDNLKHENNLKRDVKK